ncbi:hypothetical protein C8Q77DRAFT_874905 [Trametes polyzona]|nr:hypothetical protein C8Q77DRAFT_874905 [Trametes polyzona]
MAVMTFVASQDSRPSTALLPSFDHTALDSTFGAILLWWYIEVYHRNDKIVIKLFVYTTFFLESLLTAACMHACYHYLVTNFLHPESLAHAVWSFHVISLLLGPTVCVAQCFFARRVYLLRPKYRALVAISVLLSLSACVLTTVATVTNAQATTMLNPRAYICMDTLASVAAAISDMLTTSVLVVVLKQSRTGLKKSDRLLDRLILYSVNTGLLTLMFQIAAVVFAHVFPAKLVGFVCAIIGMKVYSNSLLAMVNARQSLAHDISRSRGDLISLQPLSFNRTPNDPPRLHPDDAWLPQL